MATRDPQPGDFRMDAAGDLHPASAPDDEVMVDLVVMVGRLLEDVVSGGDAVMAVEDIWSFLHSRAPDAVRRAQAQQR